MSETPMDMTPSDPKDSSAASNIALSIKMPLKLGKWLVAIPALWFSLVIAQGVLDFYDKTFLKVNFSLAGQFGDSFGGLSALMASAAAVGAWAAVAEQRTATSASEKTSKGLEASSRKRDFESTYFNLLSTFLRLAEGIDIGPVWARKSGKDAFSEFVKEVYQKKRKTDDTFETAYILTFFKHQDDLAHYIRNLFNLVHFVKDNAPGEPYFYVRLLRSTLSQPELVILALNGLYHDEGAQHFKPLIEEFALLNNISDQAKADFDLEDRYLPAAFKSKFARPGKV